jgi:ABC-type transporter Mla MlaB component
MDTVDSTKLSLLTSSGHSKGTRENNMKIPFVGKKLRNISLLLNFIEMMAQVGKKIR